MPTDRFREAIPLLLDIFPGYRLFIFSFCHPQKDTCKSNPEPVATIRRILGEASLSPDCLDIEITGSMARDNSPLSLCAYHSLRAHPALHICFNPYTCFRIFGVIVHYAFTNDLLLLCRTLKASSKAGRNILFWSLFQQCS